jgi:outer membrane protein assembly factor BamB
MKSKIFTKFLIFNILVLLLSVSFLNNVFSIRLDIDEEDGVYYLDIFEDGVNINLNNCITSMQKGKIILDPFSTSTEIYDYSEWTIQSEDKAYSYATPYFFLFLPPKISIPIFENEFDEDLGYNAIKSKNNIFYPIDDFDESSPLKIVHHFRFKTNEDVNFTENINIYWCGKAENDKQITLYYWQPIGSLGKWEVADTSVSNSSTIEIQQNFTGDLFVSEDGYIDICLIVTPNFGERCALFTDYVRITTFGQGLSMNGSATTNIISPQFINRWELLSWKDSQLGGSLIKYHLLYENESGIDNLIEETYLLGNKNGFTSPPIYLDEIPRDYDIKIQANLSTNNPTYSPEIDSLILMWQTDNNVWRDKFSTSNRIDDQDNILISNDQARILVSLNDWLMYGQNSENTRFSNGYGPGIDNHSLYWSSTNQCGTEYRNPVIKDNKLYISSIDGDEIYCFNSTIPDDEIGSSISPYYEFDVAENTVENTPAITNDNKLIIATGTSSFNGDIDNKIFAYDLMENPPESPNWVFDYGDIDSTNPYICYSASPTISQDNIFITSWNGRSSIWDSIWNFFNISLGNNKLLAIDLNGNLNWEFNLPAGSFSSPAVRDDIVIAGCENENGDSIFAFNSNDGTKIWSNNIGPIGYSCPLIYDNMVIIVTKDPSFVSFTGYEKVYALDLDDGSIIWNISIGDNIPDNYRQIGTSSPTLLNDIIYVASADGTLYAVDIDDGTKLWNKKIYTKSFTSSNFLLSSPVCVEDIIYIGTPDGIIYAINTSDKATIWEEDTYQNSPILTSPIVVNGIIYYNSENGMLYSRGKLKFFDNITLDGSIISIPIKLPGPNYIWNKFYSSTSLESGKIDFYILDKWKNVLLDDISDGSNISKPNVNNQDTIRLRADFNAYIGSNMSSEVILLDWEVTFKQVGAYDSETIFYDNSFYSTGIPPICSIDVQNEDIGLLDSAEYRFEYETQSGEFTSDWYDADFSGIDGTLDRETITADLSELDFSNDITIYSRIQFSINDAGSGQNQTKSDWYEIEYDTPDVESPVFFEETFKPSNRWISSNNPVCSIDVKDEGTKGNISGLNINSGKYSLKYRDQSGNHIHTDKTINNGINGTISTITIMADLSQLNFINNILEFQEIRFFIKDIAGNEKYTTYFDLNTDNEKPYSWITNSNEIPDETNIGPILVEANAEDNISDILHVDLWYYYNNEMIKYGEDYESPYSWNFNTQKGGEIELFTIATDYANNSEDFPSQGDIYLIFDPNKPYISNYKPSYEFEEDIPPSFDDIQFKDDYKLESIEYRLNFHNQEEWILINDNINTDSLTPSWNLTIEDWNYMIEDVEYYIYFRIIDTLGNIYETPSKSEAIKIIKNLQKDITKTPYDPDITDLETLNWNNIYKIFLNLNDTQISEATLNYRYSSNNQNWSNWTQYGETLESQPYEWEFKVDNGSGFYEFKTYVRDSFGQLHESEIQSIKVIIFPAYLIILMVISLMILLIVTVIIAKKINK